MIAEAWNHRIGTVWAGILENHGLERDGHVVEIGPGFADKIGRGLAAIAFRGTLYMVEPNDAARRWAAARYRELLPEATVVQVQESVGTASGALPAGVDALLMNHLLDDLVLHAALPTGQHQEVFGDIGPGRREVSVHVRAAWLELLADPPALRSIGRRVLDDLDRLLETTDPRVFGASQYESWTLSDAGLGPADSFGADLLSDLAVRLGETSSRDRAALRGCDQDPEHWLVLERRQLAPRSNACRPTEENDG